MGRNTQHIAEIPIADSRRRGLVRTRARIARVFAMPAAAAEGARPGDQTAIGGMRWRVRLACNWLYRRPPITSYPDAQTFLSVVAKEDGWTNAKG